MPIDIEVTAILPLPGGPATGDYLTVFRPAVGQMSVYQYPLLSLGTGSGSGTGSSPGSGSGVVNAGSANALAFYAANGTTISPLTLGTNLTIAGTTLNATGGAGPSYTGSAPISVSSGVISLAQGGASINQVLAWNGMAWAPLSLSGSYSLPAATTSTLGGVKGDGVSVSIASDGTLTVNTTTPSALTSAGALVGTDVITVNRGGTDLKTTVDTEAEYARTPVAPTTLSDSSGTITIDLTASPLPKVYDCALSGTGRTLTVNGTPSSGQTIFRIRLTGSGTITTYAGPPKWRGGSAPTLTGRDEIVFERVGSEWWAAAGSFA